MKLLKKTKWILAGLLFTALTIVSCNPDDESSVLDINEFNDAVKELKVQNRLSIGNCSTLSDIYTTHQVTAANNFKEAFDIYTNCGNSATPYSGSCCSSQTVYLNPGGGYSTSFTTYELWRPWYVPGPGIDYLVIPNPTYTLSVSEQEAFIQRAMDQANSTFIPCSGGQLVPSSYELVVVPGTVPNSNTQFARVGVKVTYDPVCLFSLP